MKKEVVEAATSKDGKLNNGMVATEYKPFSMSEDAATAILRYLLGRC